MPLKLPNLDDRRYRDLVEEARSLIPAYAPEWTNHNPSDPGIALIELFASLTEIMLYRVNRVTDANRKKFLKLLNDPGWEPQGDLVDETRRAVQGIRQVYRAVTCGDYEALVKEQFASIARARCVARINLDAGTEEGRKEKKPGHISVIIVPKEGTGEAGTLGPQPTMDQKQEAWSFLDERRTLTTRHHVVGPLYAPVNIEAVVAARTDVPLDAVRDGITQKLKSFFNPLPDGESDGWPFGRDAYVSEVCDAMEKIEGVDYVPDLLLTSACGPGDGACVAAESMWHDEGDPIGLRIAAHQLPAFRDDMSMVVIVPSTRILVIQVAIDAVPAPEADRAFVKRELKQAVRRFFHPRYDGPREDAVADVKLLIADFRAALSADAAEQGIGTVDTVSMRADLSRCEYVGTDVVSVLVTAGEVVDVRVKLNV
jgi:hypothetical protein